MGRGHRVSEVCTVVGITYRQLDYWTRTGLITPSIRPAWGSGTQRLFSDLDVKRLVAVRTLLDSGVSLQEIRRALDLAGDWTGLDLLLERQRHHLEVLREVLQEIDVLEGLEGVPA